MDELLIIHSIKAEIGVSLSGSTWTYAELSKGLDNVDESLNEVIQQYFFLSGKGFATNHVTGMAPVWKLSGRRVHGDTAQDFIFGNKYKFDTFRQSSFRITVTDASSGVAVIKTITVPCTFCAIKEFGGSTTDDSAISFEVRFNSAPVTANVDSLPALIVVSLAGLVSGQTQCYVNPALTAGNSYKYKTGITVDMLALGASAAAWSAWNGTAEIAAVTGHVIAIVEVDAGGLAVKGGSAIVTSAE